MTNPGRSPRRMIFLVDEKPDGLESTIELPAFDRGTSKHRLDSLETQKRGLMQKLLTGRWRLSH